MNVAHILLGYPWIHDLKVIHNDKLNTYAFIFGGKRITLKPSKPKEIKKNLNQDSEPPTFQKPLEIVNSRQSELEVQPVNLDLVPVVKGIVPDIKAPKTIELQYLLSKFIGLIYVLNCKQQFIIQPEYLIYTLGIKDIILDLNTPNVSFLLGEYTKSIDLTHMLNCKQLQLEAPLESSILTLDTQDIVLGPIMPISSSMQFSLDKFIDLTPIELFSNLPPIYDNQFVIDFILSPTLPNLWPYLMSPIEFTELKYQVGEPLSHKKFAHLLRLLFEEIIRLHGIPKVIAFNYNVKFSGYSWKHLWKLRGTKLQIHSQIFNHQPNHSTDLVPIHLISLPHESKIFEHAKSFAYHLHKLHVHIRERIFLNNKICKSSTDVYCRHYEFKVKEKVMIHIRLEGLFKRVLKQLCAEQKDTFENLWQLYPSTKFTLGEYPPTSPIPPTHARTMDDIDDILDNLFSFAGPRSEQEYLIKWKGRPKSKCILFYFAGCHGLHDYLVKWKGCPKSQLHLHYIKSFQLLQPDLSSSSTELKTFEVEGNDAGAISEPTLPKRSNQITKLPRCYRDNSPTPL